MSTPVGLMLRPISDRRQSRVVDRYRKQPPDQPVETQGKVGRVVTSLSEEVPVVLCPGGRTTTGEKTPFTPLPPIFLLDVEDDGGDRDSVSSTSRSGRGTQGLSASGSVVETTRTPEWTTPPVGSRDPPDTGTSSTGRIRSFLCDQVNRSVYRVPH